MNILFISFYEWNTTLLQLRAELHVATTTLPMRLKSRERLERKKTTHDKNYPHHIQ
ncbi:Hypothetical protein, putative [Bodo saltans]|uniref:Uncharacterized protein n=1 Tax=Bodo saltans TaxID=75058 RepID=A0A0S4IRB5_BODSA|nr:Hypothetical protein, putative [Bodo saltans]|eukprot:CUF03976.1 Hypothetical protein, putative [Bodo saltans]